MSYYNLLGLQKEPFSTSPDPEFFYESQEHRLALTRLLIEIRLKRGLSLILGDVGTGKTTLSRKLFQELRQRQDIVCHMILDPSNESENIFMESLARAMGLTVKAQRPTIVDLKEAIKDYLFKATARQDKTVVLLIDEAQKLNASSLEVLRTLLNYETNDYKMLQLVLLGQNELIPVIRLMPNFLDRVSLKCVLAPLSETEAAQMIDFRLKKAGYCFPEPLFTDEALKEIYKFTKGYPRRIAMACHWALKELVMKNKRFVDCQVIKGLLEVDNEFCESIAGYSRV